MKQRDKIQKAKLPALIAICLSALASCSYVATNDVENKDDHVSTFHVKNIHGDVVQCIKVRQPYSNQISCDWDHPANPHPSDEKPSEY